MTLLVPAKGSPLESRRLQRAAASGQLRRVHAGVYTADLSTPLEVLVRRELWPLTALLAPGALLSHRSALEKTPTASGDLFLTGAYRREIQLPGVTLHIASGPAARSADIRIPTSHGPLWISSDARALMENLQSSRARNPAQRRTLGQTHVERWLDQLLAREGANALNRLRDSARETAVELDWNREFALLDRLIGSLLGTRRARLQHPQAIARAHGVPYDGARVEMFQHVAVQLDATPPQIPLAPADADPVLLSFVESYFSNFIEGTEFRLEEAHNIVVKGQPIDYRQDDSHDVIGTFNAVLESLARPVFSASFESFLLQLKAWNRQVIFSRAARKPGEIKTMANRAGNTVFVAPELVVGTLMRGFELIRAARTASARAALAMFVVAEVHPFNDGNGRTARLAMNLALSDAGLTRIIVPTAFREDYLLALKALSNNQTVEPYRRMLERAGEFSHWLDLSSPDMCFRQLHESNALEHPEHAQLRFPRNTSPPVP